MSRIGRAPITLAKGVEVKMNDRKVVVKGPKGSLELDVKGAVMISQEGDQLTLTLQPEFEDAGNLHGLYRATIANMVEGVSKGFEKKLNLVGVGYRAAVKGAHLDLQLGFSHPMMLKIPEGLAVKIENNNTSIIVSGACRQKVGQFAADVRMVKPPEPYKGKGILYDGEHIRRKAGKAAAAKK